MSKLANISGKEAARAFQKAGWHSVGQVGSHLVMVKPNVRVNLSIPNIKVKHFAPDPGIGTDPL